VSDDPLEDLDDAQRAAALRWRETLRASETLDAPTAGRLAQARARALGGNRTRSPWVWATGGLTAAAIVAVLALLLQLGGPARWQGERVDAGTAEALDVLTDDLDPDFYQDLELYRWLAEDGHA